MYKHAQTNKFDCFVLEQTENIKMVPRYT